MLITPAIRLIVSAGTGEKEKDYIHILAASLLLENKTRVKTVTNLPLAIILFR